MSTEMNPTPRPADGAAVSAPEGRFPRSGNTPAPPPRAGVFSDPDVPRPVTPLAPATAGCRVADLMTRVVETVGPGDTLQAAAEKMRARGVGLLPVVDGGRLVGVLTDRDITVRGTAEGGDPTRVTVRAVMSPGPVTCSPDEAAAAVAARMRDRRVRRVVVLDPSDRLAGVVSVGDLAVDAGDDRLSGETLRGISTPDGGG